MKNIRTNHEGFAAINLGLKNNLTMSRYYWRKRKEIEYPIRWGWRIWTAIKYALIGWDFRNVRRNKNWWTAKQKMLSK